MIRPLLIHPVIHVEDPQQVLIDADIVKSAGLSSVFLISHASDDRALADAVLRVKEAHPTLSIGVNVMRRMADEALEVLAARIGDLDSVDAIWSDNCGVEEGAEHAALLRLQASRSKYGWTGRVFGGFAFKYQRPVPDHDLARLAAVASQCVDVVTTSGPGTGVAPDLRKLATIRAGIGGSALACASGVTVDNVAAIGEYVDHILVSTGVSKADGRLSADLLCELRARSRGTDPMRS